MRNSVLGLLFLIIISFYSSEANQKTFKHPYEQNIKFDENLLVKADKNDVNQAVTFYLRLVKHLFRKQRFKSDPHDDNFFIANIPLRVNKIQYDMLVDSDVNGLNLHEIDELLEKVLMQSKNEEHSIPSILLDYYRQEIIGSIPNFTSPVFLSIIAIIFILLINHLFHLSKLTYSAMIFIAIVTICCISYAMTYHDCLNDLEVEQMIQLSKENTLNNPCKDYHGERETTWSFVKAYVVGSAKNQCLEHLRKTFKPSKKYCDPLDVFARWSAKIQMSYIGSITGDFLELLTKFTSSSNIMTKMVVWIASLIFFAFLIISILKFSIKFGFQGVFGFLSSSPTTVPPKSETLEALSSKMDAILNENIEMKRELTFIRECSVERSLKNSPTRTKRHKLSSIKEANRESSKYEDDSSGS